MPPEFLLVFIATVCSYLWTEGNKDSNKTYYGRVKILVAFVSISPRCIGQLTFLLCRYTQICASFFG